MPKNDLQTLIALISPQRAQVDQSVKYGGTIKAIKPFTPLMHNLWICYHLFVKGKVKLVICRGVSGIFYSRVPQSGGGPHTGCIQKRITKKNLLISKCFNSTALHWKQSKPVLLEEADLWVLHGCRWVAKQQKWLQTCPQKYGTSLTFVWTCAVHPEEDALNTCEPCKFCYVKLYFQQCIKKKYHKHLCPLLKKIPSLLESDDFFRCTLCLWEAKSGLSKSILDPQIWSVNFE